MDNPATVYTYNNKSYKPSPSVSDKNSFFHAAFGGRTSESEVYVDKHSKVRRMRWGTFLAYFENEIMPPRLAATLKKCFSSSGTSAEENIDLEDYVSDIMTAQQHVRIEEIPILATLENIRVVVLSNGRPDPLVVAGPDRDILGDYPNAQKPKGEVVLCLEGNMYSRLEEFAEKLVPQSEHRADVVASKPTEENPYLPYDAWTKYDKGGSAGSKGVEYQVGIISVFLLNSLRKLKHWRLSTENKQAGKFDDVVLEWPDGTVMLQAKHKESKTKKITLEDLISTNSKNDDFSLPKYYMSYREMKAKFNLKSVILCTNTSVDGKTLKFMSRQSMCSDNMLHYGHDDCTFYTFKDEILPCLKENLRMYCDKISKKKDTDETTTSDENLRDFLEHLQFCCNYPPGNEIVKVTEELLSFSKTSTTLYGQISPLEIQGKLMEWFQQKTGIYLNETYCMAIFSEIWRDKQWQILEEHKVHFQRNNFNLPEKKRVLHVRVEDVHLLQEIRICFGLRNHKRKILYVCSHYSLEMQKRVVEAFELPPYTCLIIIGSKLTEEGLLGLVGDKLKYILGKYSYKSVIFVAQDEALFRYISIDDNDCLAMKDPVTFGDLSDETQNRLLKRRNVIFQGDNVSLEEMLIRDIRNPHALEKLVRNENIAVGVTLVELKEDVSRFYIKRKFERRSNNTFRNLPEESLYDVDDNIVLISDKAGTGKTTVLTKLAVGIKRRHPHLWVIRVELNDYTRILSDFLERNAETIDIQELLNSKTSTRLTNRFERDVFSLHGKVVLMLDGLDEISPDFTDMVTSMLGECQEANNFAKIIVTTRPHMTRSLEAQLNVKSFTLHPFTEKDQTEFLTSYWMHNLRLGSMQRGRCERYAAAILQKIPRWTSSEDRTEDHFAAIPLQIRMLAEIFQERHTREEASWDGCKEYLAGHEEEPELPEEMNIMKLYEMFVEKKRQVFLKKGNPSGNTAANKALSDQFKECLRYHRSLALDIILGKEKSALFSGHQQEEEHLEVAVLKMGIVQKADGQFHFMHRTFAEYFVAQSLLIELQVQNQSLEFQILFIDKILLDLNTRGIRVFLDGFLENIVDSLPSTTFERYKSNMEKMDFTYRGKLNIIHELAKDGCSAIVKLLLKCIDFEVVDEQRTKPLSLYNLEFRKKHAFSNILLYLKDILQLSGPNIKDDVGQTPLKYAVENGHLKMVKLLVQQGANAHDGSCLVVAVEIGYFDIAKFLVEQGADVKTKNRDDWSVLYNAVRRNSQNIASCLLEKLLQTDGLSKEYLLIPYAAAYLGRLDILSTLIEEGLDVDSTVENGETLIFGAARGGRLEIIEYLAGRGADVNKKDEKDQTALHVISSFPSRISTAVLLMKLGIDHKAMSHSEMTALHDAAYEGNLKLVEILVENGSDVNSAGEKGTTPLYLASSSGHMETVKFLIKHGADINLRDKDGRTALHAATFSHHSDLVDYFIGLGMDVNAKDNHGRTLLHSAALLGQLDTATALVKLGVEVNVRDHDGCTPLYLSTMWWHYDVTRFLAKHGADVKLGHDNGYTPVHLIAAIGKSKVVELVVNHGADVNCKNHSGNTPLHEAASRNNLDTATFLVHNGADMKIKNDKGCTPLHLVASGKRKMARLLVRHGADVDARDDEGRLALPVDDRQGVVGVESSDEEGATS